MSAKSPVDLRLELGASRALAAVLVVVHGGGLAIAVLLSLTPLIRIALIAFVIASLYHGLCRHALRSGAGAVTAFSLSDDGRCAVQRGTGAWEDARLLDRSVHPLLTILVVRCDARCGPTSVVIAADAVAAEAFRRLRVRLRLQTVAA